jgi:hypothetical protein
VSRRLSLALAAAAVLFLVVGCGSQPGAASPSSRSAAVDGSATVPESWTDSATAPKPRPEVDVVEPVAAGYVGSILSDKYHRTRCRKGSQIPPENQVFFPSVADARKAGYRPCRICRPPRR